MLNCQCPASSCPSGPPQADWPGAAFWLYGHELTTLLISAYIRPKSVLEPKEDLNLTGCRQSNSIAVAESYFVFSYLSEQSYVIAIIKENCILAL